MGRPPCDPDRDEIPDRDECSGRRGHYRRGRAAGEGERAVDRAMGG